MVESYVSRGERSDVASIGNCDLRGVNCFLNFCLRSSIFPTFPYSLTCVQSNDKLFSKQEEKKTDRKENDP